MTGIGEGPVEPATAPAPPTCYRHRDRETYLRCSRCDRPICPDCMTPAAVGQQCPECVAEGRRSTPTARTALGGRLTERAGMVTRALIVLNVLAFLAQRLLGDAITSDGAMVPFLVADGEFYRLVSAAFLHTGVLHLGFNMFALYMIGQQLEHVLGAGRYLALYLLSAVGGNVLVYLLAPPFQGGIGASGAVFGLFAALFIIGRRLSADVSQVALLIGVNLVLTFVFPNIDWRAHIGGLVTGAVLAAVFAYAPRKWRDPAAVGAAMAVILVLAALVVVRTAALTA